MSLRAQGKIAKFAPQQAITLDWPTFNGGLNTFKKPTELNPNELAQADNMMLVGTGTPTGRWGSANYNWAGTARVRLLDAYYNSTTSTNLLLTITDSGLMTKKNGASFSIITGASFASGYTYQSTEIANNTYIAAASQNFVRFDGTNLIPYVGLSTPTNVSVAVLSAVSGTNTWSWQITATSLTGETLPSVFKSLASLPLDLTTTTVKVSWNSISAAASTHTGFNIYRGSPGNETYIASVDPTATSFLDTGGPQSNTLFPPNNDTTAGPKAKYIKKFGDRTVLAGIQGDPSAVYISGRYPYQDNYTAITGGAICYVSPDDGDEITGIEIQALQTINPLIVIYKKFSTYVISLSTVTLGQFVILDPQIHLLTRTAGASNGDTVTSVENDVFSFGTKGLYSTGQEPQFLNQIRSNEISARIRPYIRSLSNQDFQEATSAYIDYKYVLSFPSRKETIIYDRQRSAFMGPWMTPFGITKWFKYYDPSGAEVWLAGCDDGYVRYFSDSLLSDSGTAIAKTLRTRKEDMKQWNMMKMLNYFYFNMRNVRGSVTINLRIEDRTGNTVTSKTATITSTLGDGGWGGDQWGQQSFGQTEATVILSGDELARYSTIFKQFRVMQVEVVSSGATTNFEFLGVRVNAVSLGPISLPTRLKI